jgi:hypothetical protein
MNEVCLVVHPYTARKDIGAGHDRYAYEIVEGLKRRNIKYSIFESGHIKTVTGALAAEVTGSDYCSQASVGHNYPRRALV